MTLKLYTFRAKHSGKICYATGHNILKASLKTGLPSKDLELLTIQTMPAQERFTPLDSTISRNTVRYIEPT